MLNAERAVMENPRRELVFVGPAPGFSVLLKRNCSISPAALARVFALLVAVTLGIGIAFAAVGAWLVLPFAGIEVVVLAAAFIAKARHAAVPLRSNGRDFEVGRHLHERARAELAAELAKRMRN